MAEVKRLTPEQQISLNKFMRDESKNVKNMSLEEQTKLAIELSARLVEALEELNKIRPIQFLDCESEYVYNYSGVLVCPEDDRVYIKISGVHDNLPSHAKNPLRDGHGQLIYAEKQE